MHRVLILNLALRLGSQVNRLTSLYLRGFNLLSYTLLYSVIHEEEFQYPGSNITYLNLSPFFLQRNVYAENRFVTSGKLQAYTWKVTHSDNVSSNINIYDTLGDDIPFASELVALVQPHL